MTKYERIANARAEEAQIEIADMAKAATERMNRSVGQITRHTLARIELARRGVK